MQRFIYMPNNDSQNDLRYLCYKKNFRRLIWRDLFTFFKILLGVFYPSRQLTLRRNMVQKRAICHCSIIAVNLYFPCLSLTRELMQVVSFQHILEKVLFSQLSRMTELMRQRDYVYSKSESRSANEQTHDLPELDRLT